ncbi:MAG: DNA repair protein RecO [Gammaproteobacteria bacterium]
MSESAVYLQPAFILQQRSYRESSVLFDVFTRDFGVIPMLARGVRKEKSKTAGVLQPFSLLRLSYLDKHELKTLTSVEQVVAYPLQRLALYCGFYVNELVQRFLHKHDPHPQLFVCYHGCLQALLEAANIEQALRFFELDLLEEAGYGIQLDISAAGADPSRRYNFVAERGMVEDSEGEVGIETLQALRSRRALSDVSLLEAKRLIRSMLDVHLQGRPLKSREVLAKIIRYL